MAWKHDRKWAWASFPHETMTSLIESHNAKKRSDMGKWSVPTWEMKKLVNIVTRLALEAHSCEICRET